MSLPGGGGCRSPGLITGAFGAPPQTSGHVGHVGLLSTTVDGPGIFPLAVQTGLNWQGEKSPAHMVHLVGGSFEGEY